MTSLLLAFLVGLFVAQIGTFATTVYLHRALSHRSLTMKPAVRAVFLRTGRLPRESDRS